MQLFSAKETTFLTAWFTCVKAVGRKNTHHVRVWHRPETCHVDVCPHFCHSFCNTQQQRVIRQKHCFFNELGSRFKKTDLLFTTLGTLNTQNTVFVSFKTTSQNKWINVKVQGFIKTKINWKYYVILKYLLHFLIIELFQSFNWCTAGQKYLKVADSATCPT